MRLLHFFTILPIIEITGKLSFNFLRFFFAEICNSNCRFIFSIDYFNTLDRIANNCSLNFSNIVILSAIEDFSSILHGLFWFCFRKGKINSPLKKLKTENKELCVVPKVRMKRSSSLSLMVL